MILCGSLVSGALAGQDYDPPAGYYDTAESLIGEPLRLTLHDIIDGHFVGSYSALFTAMAELDRDPDNPDNIILLYSGDSIPHSASSWNREHTWPRSYGADSGAAYSDAHHLFPADAVANEDRSNYAFSDLTVFRPLDNASDSKANDSLRLVEPRDADKGRIARALFYMETRYDGSDSGGDFTLSDDPVSSLERMGVLSSLLRWNREFPPDEREKRRNDLIYKGFVVNSTAFFQSNRNPYIDYPDLVDAAYTADFYTTWGSWKYSQFPLASLNDPAVIGELVDLDSDYLPLLMEFAFQTDPHVATGDSFPYIDRGNGVNYFIFNRIKQPQHSSLEYLVEVSTSPLEADSWIEIPYTSRDLLRANRGDYEVVSLLHVPTDISRPSHYRLVLARDTASTDPVEIVFDPAIFPQQLPHLFSYAERLQDSLVKSDWFGEMDPYYAPWFIHTEHGLIHTQSSSEQSAWFYDMSLGWFYAGIGFYPYIFSPELGWLYFAQQTTGQNRWFYSLILGKFTSVLELLDNNP